MNIIKALCLLLLSFSLYANDIDDKMVKVELQDQISQLDDLQRKQLLIDLKEGSNNNDVWENRVEALSKLGVGISAALTSTVKDLGVTVNEFAATPVGFLTFMVILWHYIGEDIWDVIVGVFVLILGAYISKRSFQHAFCILKEDGKYIFDRETLMAKEYPDKNYVIWWLFWFTFNIVILISGITLIA